MELVQLKYFRSIAKYQNMSRAAGELYVTQSTLSQSIKRLEAELGGTLFDRYGKNITLNSRGKLLLIYADQILNLLGEMERELSDLSADSGTAVSISINTSTKLLTRLLPIFREKHPIIRFYVEQNDFSMPDKDDYDICINCSKEPPVGENTKTVLRERVLLALPVGHPLSTLPSIPMSRLEGESFIQLDGKELTDQFHSCCNAAGFVPNIAFHCDYPSSVVDFVEMGLGIALFPEISWSTNPSRALILRPIQDLSPVRYISVSWRKNTYLSQNACLFRNFFIDYMQANYPESIPDQASLSNS